MQLRPYQLRATDEACELFKEHQRVLTVLPTGTGKTHVAVEHIRRCLANTRLMVLILAHRNELLDQAANKVMDVLGEPVGVEKADRRVDMNSWYKPRVIVSSVQTQYSGDGALRCERFNPDHFGLVIADEAHHYIAPKYRKVLDHYLTNPECRLLGITATPDRSDEKAMGRVFTAHTTPYGIRDAIADGWLCPVKQRMCWVEGFDIESLHTVAGDFNRGELAQMTEDDKNLARMAAGILDATDCGRRALVYTVRVEGAMKMAAYLNSQKPNSAEFIHGKTDPELRRELFARHQAGEYQYMVNVGIATEGYDDPGAVLCVNCRPTKSRSLYTQIVGRVMRPLPGVVDAAGPDAEARIDAIARSAKPWCEVMDFVGNVGKHSLICTADILGGKYDDEDTAQARKAASEAKEPVDMDKLLDEIKEHREAERRRMLAEAERLRQSRLKGKTRSTLVDPFGGQLGWMTGTITRPKSPDAEMATEGQTQAMVKLGIDPEGVTKKQASRVIGEANERRSKKLCSPKQAMWLERFGYDSKNVTFDAASRVLDVCFSTPRNTPKPPADYYGPDIAAMLSPGNDAAPERVEPPRPAPQRHETAASTILDGEELDF